MKIDNKWIGFYVDGSVNANDLLRDIVSSENITLDDVYFDTISFVRNYYHLKFDGESLVCSIFSWFMFDFRVISCDPFVFRADGAEFICYRR